MLSGRFFWIHGLAAWAEATGIATAVTAAIRARRARRTPGSLAASVRPDEQDRCSDRKQADDPEVEPAERAREQAVHVLPHDAPVVAHQQNRQVGQREHRYREDHRVLGELDGVHAGLGDGEAGEEESYERECEPGLVQKPEALAPLPALVLGEVVGRREAGVDRGTADGE